MHDILCQCACACVCASVCAAIIQADKPKAISKGNKNDNRSQFPYCLHEFYIQMRIRIRFRFDLDVDEDLDLNLPALTLARPAYRVITGCTLVSSN